MTRTDKYEVKGIVYMETEEEDVNLDNMNLTVEVEAEYNEADPEVGYMHPWWDDTESEAKYTAEDLIEKMFPNFTDYDIKVKLIEE